MKKKEGKKGRAAETAALGIPSNGNGLKTTNTLPPTGFFCQARVDERGLPC